MPAITAFLEAINSKRDRNGNCYWALRYTDCESGKVLEASISGGESNINAARYHLNPEGKGIQFSTSELPIREFNRFNKALPYAGCHPLTIAGYIRQQLTGLPPTFVVTKSKQLEFPYDELVRVITKAGGFNITPSAERVIFDCNSANITNVISAIGDHVRYLDNRVELVND